MMQLNFSISEYRRKHLTENVQMYILTAPTAQVSFGTPSWWNCFVYYLFHSVRMEAVLYLRGHWLQLHNFRIQGFWSTDRQFAIRSLCVDFYNHVSVIIPFRKQWQTNKHTHCHGNRKLPTKVGFECAIL